MSTENSSDNKENKALTQDDVRSMLIEFGDWLEEDDYIEINYGHIERVVDRFLNSIN
jgi:hypothetical protein